VIREEGAKSPSDIGGLLYLTLRDRSDISLESQLRENLTRMLEPFADRRVKASSGQVTPWRMEPHYLPTSGTEMACNPDQGVSDSPGYSLAMNDFTDVNRILP
jgi:hypothetical protein